MKKQKYSVKNTSSLPKKIAIVLLVGLLLVAIGAALEQKSIINFFGPSEVKGQAEAESVNADKKKSLIEDDVATDTGTDTPATDTQKAGSSGTAYTPPESSDSILLSAKQNNDSTVVVTTKLFGYSDGTCTLNINNGTKNNSQNASIIYQKEFSTCAGFSLPSAELGTGTWSIDLKVTARDITQSKSIKLEVR